MHSANFNGLEATFIFCYAPLYHGSVSFSLRWQQDTEETVYVSCFQPLFCCMAFPNVNAFFFAFGVSSTYIFLCHHSSCHAITWRLHCFTFSQILSPPQFFLSIAILRELRLIWWPMSDLAWSLRCAPNIANIARKHQNWQKKKKEKLVFKS